MKKLYKSILAFPAKIWGGIKHKFISHFPGKSTINPKAIAIWTFPSITVLVIGYCYLANSIDTSRFIKTAQHIVDKLANKPEAAQVPIKGVAKETPPPENQNKTKEQVVHVPKLTYRAKQVIERGDYADPNYTLPTGTEIIGRLATSIDSRNPGSLIKIELPFGGSFQGNELIPKGSLLFAVANYDGNGEKVFLDIQSGQFPDGQDFRIRAQALSAKDFSPGLAGDYHGTLTNRVAANLGLSFVSGLTDTLIEKESVGSGGLLSGSTVAPKPTVKNGILSGVSKVTDMESKAVAQELSSQKPFVTVDSGKELIVSLLERFVKGALNESGQKYR